MFFHKKDQPPERFYLFPGQGGKNYHRKQRVFMGMAVVVALICGLALAAMMWWWAHPGI